MKKLILTIGLLFICQFAFAGIDGSVDEQSTFGNKIVRPRFALDFDGANDYVQIQEGADVDISGNTKFSWEFTFAADSDGEGNLGVMYIKREHDIRTTSETGDGVKLQIQLDFGAGTDAKAITNGRFSVGVKRHCVMVFNEDSANKIKIYMNGVLQALSTDTAAVGTLLDDTSSDMILGAGSTGGENSYDGKIYEFRVYPGTVLTANQASILFKGGKFSTMTGYWDFHEGEGTVLNDIKNNNDGTISGAIWVDG